MYSSQKTVRMIKSLMRWAGHVTHMGEKNAYIESWWESQKKRDY
jgi:hypothetical protein